jgi:hypothetical protein
LRLLLVGSLIPKEKTPVTSMPNASSEGPSTHPRYDGQHPM